MGIKKKWTINIYNNIDESEIHYTKWKNLGSEGYIWYYLYDIQEKAKLKEQKSGVVVLYLDYAGGCTTGCVKSHGTVH